VAASNTVSFFKMTLALACAILEAASLTLANAEQTSKARERSSLTSAARPLKTCCQASALESPFFNNWRKLRLAGA
jgi:hypothetical protein